MPVGIKNYPIALSLVLSLFWPLVATADPTSMTVYKTASCGCCNGWIDHMRANGFEVTTRDVQQSELSRVKSHYRVPEKLHSCHTAVIEGYVVEGHVPAHIVSRFLRERPLVTGISAPGMPAASPGMDVPSGGPYDVVIFDADGGARLYERVE